MTRYTAAMVTTVTTVVAINHENPMAVQELAHACGADPDWVAQLVELGIVQVESPAVAPGDWRFYSADLQCALEVRRLQRDFGVALDVAALILDLQHEVRRLKAALRARGLQD